MTRDDLPDAVVAALRNIGGTGSVARVAEQIWLRHESELRNSGDLFFTWQYEMRWAAQKLRDAKRLVHTRKDGRSVWQLV